jgi:PIN domain nuclease of toxin-antitoxin system
MRILLDSHVFIWAKSAPENLSSEVRAAIIDPDNEVFVSIASAWELWIKHAKKPISVLGPVLNAGASGFLNAASESGIAMLEITLQDAVVAARLPLFHRDPFDRMLIAQATRERLTLVTRDPAFRRYKGFRLLEA